MGQNARIDKGFVGGIPLRTKGVSTGTSQHLVKILRILSETAFLAGRGSRSNRAPATQGLRPQTIVYLGPPPPSGGTHSIFSKGSFTSQVLQWTQFEKLSFTFGLPVTSSVSNSYTPAGQNLTQGL